MAKTENFKSTIPQYFLSQIAVSHTIEKLKEGCVCVCGCMWGVPCLGAMSNFGINMNNTCMVFGMTVLALQKRLLQSIKFLKNRE